MPPRPEAVVIDGPAGVIEALVEVPAGYDGRRVAVVCHPHPLFGGTMTNKVVHTCARALQELGFATLRFNFRGVGASDGVFDNGVGETTDALAVCGYATLRFPGATLSVAGFSFGSFVAYRVAARLPVTHLVLIAPPVERFDFAATDGAPRPTVVIQGDVDDVVPASDVIRWVGEQQPTVPLSVITGAGHFFHGKLGELRAAVQAATA